MQLKVKKRNGIFEEFNPEKIRRVVQAAGLSSEQARVLLERIQQIVGNHQDSHITSLALRDMVHKELQKLYQPAANLFAWYQKTKEGK